MKVKYIIGIISYGFWIWGIFAHDQGIMNAGIGIFLGYLFAQAK